MPANSLCYSRKLGQPWHCKGTQGLVLSLYYFNLLTHGVLLYVTLQTSIHCIHTTIGVCVCVCVCVCVHSCILWSPFYVWSIQEVISFVHACMCLSWLQLTARDVCMHLIYIEDLLNFWKANYNDSTSVRMCYNMIILYWHLLKGRIWSTCSIVADTGSLLFCIVNALHSLDPNTCQGSTEIPACGTVCRFNWIGYST